MLNFECIDELHNGNVELCFSDSDGDESVKIYVSPTTAWEIAKEIQKRFSFAGKRRPK